MSKVTPRQKSHKCSSRWHRDLAARPESQSQIDPTNGGQEGGELFWCAGVTTAVSALAVSVIAELSKPALLIVDKPRS